jgi:protease-4
MSADEKAFIKRELMDPLHQNFIELMKEGRGNKLDVSNPQLFTGMVWSGNDAMKLGLVDAVQTTNQLEKELMEKYGVTDIQVVQKEGFSVMNMLKSAISDGIAMSTERVLEKEFAQLR